MKLKWPPTLKVPSAWPAELRWTRHHTAVAAVTVIAVLYLALSTCSPKVPLLTRVEALQIIRVATLNSPTTYYVGAAGPTGFEYDLTRAFAHSLGVEIEILVAESPAEVIELVRSGRAHLGAGLAITTAREKLVEFTAPLRYVTPQLVYRAGSPRPRTLYDLDDDLLVPAGSAVSEMLATVATINPQVRWRETADSGTEQLLFEVARGGVAYTIAPSDLVSINRRYYPELRVAFTLSDTQSVGWAFARGDDSLSRHAVDFLERFDRAELARVHDRYFGHVSKVGHYGALALATHTQTRLPRYREAFEAAAARYGLDWRLLAAVGYQESLWDPSAVSPTGVRGLMQITTDTAEFLNIQNRLDPVESIYGAARYLQQIHSRLPPEIPEPDRTWMTLAAYNVGFGHVLDVRQLTESLGGNPNRWVDVREHLPKLTLAKWHRQTRHGYARGHEAVTYVGNIRSYYDMLTWITGGVRPADDDTASDPEKTDEEKDRKDPLNITSPIL